MNKTMNLFFAFIAMLVIAFFAIGFTSSVTPPANNTTAGQQYTNLSKVTDIASAGVEGTILLLVGAMAISGFALFYYSISRK